MPGAPGANATRGVRGREAMPLHRVQPGDWWGTPCRMASANKAPAPPPFGGALAGRPRCAQHGRRSSHPSTETSAGDRVSGL